MPMPYVPARAPVPARALSLFLLPFLLLLLPFLPLSGTAAAADGPTVTLSKSQAGTGGSITVGGSGWRSRTLLMVLVCGQATPARGVVGGTNSCANADGRAVTTDAGGRFSRTLPVAEPPVPCPCVVHVATATGAKAQADAVFQVAGHEVRPLPAETAGGRLSMLTDTRLEGSGSLLTWFGAPPSRTLVFTVGNAGTAPVQNPVFQVGTAHGVFAPQWDEREWRGTLRPGEKARVELPVELAAGARGDYTVSLRYGGKVLAEQPWGVGRPWGVTLFWILLCLVVPAAVFRIGMAVVDRIRPRQPTRRPSRTRWRGIRRTSPDLDPEPVPPPSTATLPWFTPATGPDPAGRLSAPHEDRGPADRAGSVTPAGLGRAAGSATPAGSATSAGSAASAGCADRAGSVTPAGLARPAGSATRAGSATSAGPADPAGSATPAGPATPAGRATSTGPATPAGPTTPAASSTPTGPTSHTGPATPTCPETPTGPATPTGVRTPTGPGTPKGPTTPTTPGGKGTS